MNNGATPNKTMAELPGYFICSYFVVVILSYVVSPRDRLGGGTFVDEMYAVILLPFALYFAVSNIIRSPRLYFIYAYLGMGILSGLIYYSRGLDTGYTGTALLLGTIYDLKPVVAIIGMAGMFQACGARADALRVVMKFLVGLALLNSLFCLRDILLQADRSIFGFPVMRSGLGIVYPSGLYTHKTGSASIVSLGVISAAFLFFRNKSMLYGVVAGGLFVILAAHQAAKEIIGALYCAVLAFSYARTNRFRLFHPVALAALAIAGPFGYIALGDLIESRIELYVESDSIRSMLYQGAVDIARSFFPFGSGFGTFGSPPTRDVYYSGLYFNSDIATTFGGSPNYPLFLCDTWWPKVLAESGLVGTVCYIIFIASPFIGARKHDDMPDVMVWCLLICVLVLVSSVASPAFVSDSFIIILGSAWGAFLVNPQRAYRANFQASMRRRSRQPTSSGWGGD